jgi:hypothetical protein
MNSCESCHFYTGPDIAEAERQAKSRDDFMGKKEGVCLALPSVARCTPYRQACIYYRDGMKSAIESDK